SAATTTPPSRPPRSSPGSRTTTSWAGVTAWRWSTSSRRGRASGPSTSARRAATATTPTPSRSTAGRHDPPEAGTTRGGRLGRPVAVTLVASASSPPWPITWRTLRRHMLTTHETFDGVRGAVITPDSPDYPEAARTPLGDSRPAVVLRPRDVDDVRRAVRAAAADGRPVAVRGGGHSFARLGTVDDGLVIDLAALDGVRLVGSDRVVVGGGATWGAVAQALARHGLAISSGDTASVGGLLLSGGIGWMVRAHGLALDRLVSAQVVTAAAGGVGGLLAQLLVATGARVVGLAGDARKREHARSLGADVVVDYRAPGWVEQVRRAAPEGVDVVFDGVSGDLPDLLLPAVRSGGRYVQHGAAAGRWTRIEADRAAAAGVTVVPLAAIGTPEELHGATDEALRRAAEGRLRVTVGQVFPLAEAAAAHAALGSREALGKTLLRP